MLTSSNESKKYVWVKSTNAQEFVELFFIITFVLISKLFISHCILRLFTVGLIWKPLPLFDWFFVVNILELTFFFSIREWNPEMACITLNRLWAHGECHHPGVGSTGVAPPRVIVHSPLTGAQTQQWVGDREKIFMLITSCQPQFLRRIISKRFLIFSSLFVTLKEKSNCFDLQAIATKFYFLKTLYRCQRLHCKPKNLLS